jgi:hypothetical protein
VEGRMTSKEYKELISKKKKRKYRNKIVSLDGHRFDSQKEAQFYSELKILKSKGIVKKIELQPKFLLQEGFTKNGERYRPINYYADFRVTYSDGSVEIVDVKGTKTNVYKLKKKLFEKKYPDLTIKEV